MSTPAERQGKVDAAMRRLRDKLRGLSKDDLIGLLILSELARRGQAEQQERAQAILAERTCTGLPHGEHEVCAECYRPGMATDA